MHPGVVDSNFASYADAGVQAYLGNHDDKVISQQGADTLIWLAKAQEPGESSGNYYYQRQAIATSAAGNDLMAAERLWPKIAYLTTGAAARIRKRPGISSPR